jgi:hypothetical protein
MRFRYLKDPLFLFCVGLYFVNRWLLKPHFHNTFLHSYLNDVICIPFWVPIMLFIMKTLQLRRNDHPPTAFEILIPLILWSWVFEAYLPFTPLFKQLATSDYRDVLAYAIGACVSAFSWKFLYQYISVANQLAFLRRATGNWQQRSSDTLEKHLSGS